MQKCPKGARLIDFCFGACVLVLGAFFVALSMIFRFYLCTCFYATFSVMPWWRHFVLYTNSWYVPTTTSKVEIGACFIWLSLRFAVSAPHGTLRRSRCLFLTFLMLFSCRAGADVRAVICADCIAGFRAEHCARQGACREKNHPDACEGSGGICDDILADFARAEAERRRVIIRARAGVIVVQSGLFDVRTAVLEPLLTSEFA